jgi:hypothetical protein
MVVAITLGLLVARALRRRPTPPSSPPAAHAPAVPTTPGALPVLAVKPVPVVQAFDGCPPEGQGGDPTLNRLKNRIDEGQYTPVNFEAIASLDWARGIERRDRDRWSSADAAAIAQWEGLPISVEGYIAESHAQGPESCNCHRSEPDQVDFHLWLIRTPGDTRAQSIVAEISPRVRRGHPSWTTKSLGRLARDRERVRISGWLFMDPEHPDQIGKTRATLWEIHPIMQVEVYRAGAWQRLDDLGE